MTQQNPEKLIFHEADSNAAEYNFDNIIPTYSVAEQNAETVCLSDNRTKVVSTTSLPYKAICKLYMKAANGDNLIGTGWLSHANKLYTAAHCVYSHKRGGWMQRIIVVPGQSGFTTPYGRYEAKELAATVGWIDDKSPEYDKGGIKLTSNVSHTDFIIPTVRDVDVATVCGYPGDRDSGYFQYKMQDIISKKGDQFFYQIDTFGGQSGSPLLKNSSHSIGIHNYGGCPNKASDLHPVFIDEIDKW